MDMEIDYDIDKKKNFKEVKLFLSILPDNTKPAGDSTDFFKEFNIDITASNDIPTLHFPLKNTFNDRTKFIIDNKQNCLNLYKQKKEIFNEMLANTFIVIAVDDNLTSFNKAIANFVNICYGNEIENYDLHTLESSENSVESFERRIFITNFSLVKKFRDENLKKYKVYLLPQEHSIIADSFFKKLEYLHRFIQDLSLRKEYFSRIIHDFNLMQLDPSEKFLQIRNEFLRTINKNNKAEMLKDPISKDIIFPLLNMMVLTYPKETCIENHKDEYCINKIDFKFFESDFIQKFQRHLVNSDITFVAYLDSEEMLCRLNENLEELPILADELFINKSLSINFGKIEKIEEMGCGHYNFMNSCPGSLIYSSNFMPLGITTVKDYNQSAQCSFNSIATTQPDLKFHPNSFLPFSNKGVISIFKKFMNIEKDFHNFSRNKLFAIERPMSEHENIKFLNNYLWRGSENHEHIFSNYDTIKVNPVYFNQKFSEKTQNEAVKNNSKNLLTMNRRNNYHVTKMDKDKLQYVNKLITDKLRNKSFNFAPFNRILEDRKNHKISLASLIDDTILNLFK